MLLLVWYLREAQHSSAEEKGDELNYIIISVTLTFLDIMKRSVKLYANIIYYYSGKNWLLSC